MAYVCIYFQERVIVCRLMVRNALFAKQKSRWVLISQELSRMADFSLLFLNGMTY